MAKELLKHIVLTCFLIGVVKCWQEDEFQRHPLYGTYITPKVKESNVSQPENVRCTVISSTMIYVNWDAPIIGIPQYYIIRWYWEGMSYEPTPFLETEYNMTDLEPSTKYRIIVSSSDGDAESLAPEVNCETFIQPETNVSQPENVRCTVISSNMIYVNWDAPTTGRPQYYIIRWYWEGTSFEPTPFLETEYNMTDLLPCTKYRIIVSSSDGAAESQAPSVDCETFTPLESPPPTNVELNITAPDKAIVTWDPPKAPCIYVNYSITWTCEPLWGDGQACGGGEDYTNPSADMTYKIDGLTPYSNVTACVSAALEDTDFGEPSCASGITMQDSPGPPTMQGVTQTIGLATVTWIPPEILNGVIENYTLNWRTTESGESSTSVGNVLFYDLTLNPCETYYFKVSAKTAAPNWGSPSNEIDATILNYIPTDKVRCSNNPDGSVTVSWSTASPTCLVSGFHVEYNWTSLWSEDHGSSSSNLGADNMELKVRDPLPYSEIHSCVGVGDKLDNGGCCTINSAQGVPGPPENMTHGKLTEAEVNVTWAEPIVINGVLGNWFLSLNIEDKQLSNVTLSPETRSYELVDMLPNTNYNVTLQASTEAGFGDAAFCIISTPIEGEGGASNLAAIIGGTVGALLGIAVIVAAVFFGRKWKASKTERRHTKNGKERQMAQTSERNVDTLSSEKFEYGTKPFPNSNGKQNFRRVTSNGYDNHNFRMPKSDTNDGQEYRQSSSQALDKHNIRSPMSEAINKQHLRRYPVDINEIKKFRRPSVDTNETRNFRRTLEDIDEINDSRRPSVDTSETRNFRRPSTYNDEINNVRRPSTDFRRPLTGTNEIRNFRRPSTDFSEIQNIERPYTKTREPSADTNENQNIRRPYANIRRSSTDTSEMQNLRRYTTPINKMQNVRRPSTDINEMQNVRGHSADITDIQNFKQPSSHDYANQYFRKPSPLAYDSRNFRRPAPQPYGKHNFKKPAPSPYNKQISNRPAPGPYDDQNFRRPSSDFYDNRDSKVSLSKRYKEEDVESIDL